jgi:hypothetical protein
VTFAPVRMMRIAFGWSDCLGGDWRGTEVGPGPELGHDCDQTLGNEEFPCIGIYLYNGKEVKEDEWSQS